jgi:hypothetical protein
LEEANQRGFTMVEMQVDQQQIEFLWKDERRHKLAGIHILEELKILGNSFHATFAVFRNLPWN